MIEKLRLETRSVQYLTLKWQANSDVSIYRTLGRMGGKCKVNALNISAILIVSLIASMQILNSYIHVMSQNNGRLRSVDGYLISVSASNTTNAWLHFTSSSDMHPQSWINPPQLAEGPRYVFSGHTNLAWRTIWCFASRQSRWSS